MKKIILFSLCFMFFVTAGLAQMSDSQVLNYVKQEHTKGTSQDQIATDLVKRGVTKAQLERINKTVNGAGEATTTANTGTFNLDQSRERTQMPNETGLLLSGTMDVPTSGGKQVFGRTIFNAQNLTFSPNANIPTPANYRLGPGDEVIIDIWGVSQASFRQTISPEGRITVDRLGPLYLNGMTIQEANNYVQRKFAEVYGGLGEGGDSQIQLTLGQIRTIQIQVMGEVVRPGTYAISSLASIFHALYIAGGVNDIGSLRAITLVRNGKPLRTLDVYKYLLEGKLNEDIRLTDNDVVMVPPYISLVDIEGNVKRPMYYEMKDNETVADLLMFAGGFAGNAYADKVRLARSGGAENQLFTLLSDQYKTFKLADKDVVTVSQGLDEYKNRVEIIGAVYREGYYEIGNDIQTVKQLIAAADGVRGDAFLNRAILTREKADLTTEILPIDVQGLLNGTVSDIVLHKNDALFIPSANALKRQGDFVVFGAVTRPGGYKYADNTTLEDLLVQAGGLLESASMVRVDIARRVIDPRSMTTTNTLAQTFSFGIKDGLVVDGTSGFILQPYDQVYVRQSPGYHVQQNVHIDGEVLFPGTYVLNKKTERLSDIVKRAGNLTPDAYAKSARLIRQRSSDENFRAQQAFKLAQKSVNDSIDVAELDLAPTFTIGIELDKAVQNPGSDYDVVLKEGDRLVIPEYDNIVKIDGAVMYPNTVVYKAGQKASYYINQAGGYSDNAKKNKGYVIYMNGTVAKIKGSDKNLIQPGSVIIVPTKEEKSKMSTGEIISISSSVASMATVIALLINSF
ncbi:MAG: SLBB domain-containing protein [Candidatus Symbiothrix sp.]|jgi:protein involved in polysaccharide export with SLBB domain|nr:SLBB domain-containing protein [Candidatus Symbiothrix sp.]